MEQVNKLCKLAQHGDRDAACKLVEIFYKQIYSYLHRLSGSSKDAEDLTQETFTKVWKSLGSYKRRCGFSTWLYRIAYQRYVDWLRSRKAATLKNETWWDDISDDSSDPASNVEKKLLSEKLYMAVDKLSSDKRNAINLRYYQGLSVKDTAYVMDKPYSTVKYILRQSLKQLAKEMNSVAASSDQTDSFELRKNN